MIIIHCDRVGFIIVMEIWFNIYQSKRVIQHKNYFKDRNHMMLLVGIEKAFNKSLISVHYNEKSRNQIYINIINSICDKSIPNSILNMENLKVFPPKSGAILIQYKCVIQLEEKNKSQKCNGYR